MFLRGGDRLRLLFGAIPRPPRRAAAPSSTASRLAGAANKRDKMGRLAGARAPAVATRASSDEDGGAGAKTSLMGKADELLEKVGLSLGPIGMTLGESKSPSSASSAEDVADDASLMGKAGELMDKAGVSLGPIGMTLGESPSSSAADPSADAPADAPCQSIANMTTEEWREKFVNPDGTVDLFLEDEYNAALATRRRARVRLSHKRGEHRVERPPHGRHLRCSTQGKGDGSRHGRSARARRAGEPIRALRGGAGRMGTAQRLS